MKRFIDICQFLLVLAGLSLCGLFLTSLVSLLPFGGIESQWQQWVLFTFQNILAWIVPALLTWKLCFKSNPIVAIGGAHAPGWKMICVAILIFFVGMPALNQIIYWNQEMHLPESFAAFEKWSRELEELAAEQTEGLLSTTAIFPTLMNIFVIGILTGIGEEFFFRGALQRMLITCRVNPHIAIWSAAFIFSAIHFQFFGFFPRMLLGAFFGYLYWWSGNIWVNSFAHALNNSLVIISTWLINKGILSEEFDMTGVSESGFALWCVISIIAVCIIITFLYKKGILVNNRELPPELPTNPAGHANEI